MGQKVNPRAYRTAPTLMYSWTSQLFAERANYTSMLHQDLDIRAIIEQRKDYIQAQISEIQIERFPNKNITINIHAKKPGVVIGKSGNGIEKLKKEIEKISNDDIYINIHEVKKPNIDALIIAKNIATQLEDRVSAKRAMKTASQASMKQGAKGIKIACSGRNGGAEIARTEKHSEGRMPRHTLRAIIDYGFAEAKTTFGIIGVKVWVYKGDYVDNKKKSN